MFVSALPDPTCNSEKSANGGNKQILLLLLLSFVSLTIAGTFNNFLSHCYKIIERINEERVIPVSYLQQFIILDIRANANDDRRDTGVPESSQNCWRLFTAQTV